MVPPLTNCHRPYPKLPVLSSWVMESISSFHDSLVELYLYMPKCGEVPLNVSVSLTSIRGQHKLALAGIDGHPVEFSL